MSSKYYTVWIGRKTGVFDSWTECRDATLGYSGSVFRAFTSRQEALDALETEYLAYSTYLCKSQNYSKQSSQPPLKRFLYVNCDFNAEVGIVQYSICDSDESHPRLSNKASGIPNEEIGIYIAILNALHDKIVRENETLFTPSILPWRWTQSRGITSDELNAMRVQPSTFQMIERLNNWLRCTKFEPKVKWWPEDKWSPISNYCI